MSKPIQSEGHWRNLNVEYLSTSASRSSIRKCLIEAKNDIIVLHEMLRQKQENKET